MRQPTLSGLIGMLVLGTSTVAQAQGTADQFYTQRGFGSPSYSGGPKTGSYAGVPTGIGPLSQPIPPATSAWAYRPWYGGQMRTLRRRH